MVAGEGQEHELARMLLNVFDLVRAPADEELHALLSGATPGLVAWFRLGSIFVPGTSGAQEDWPEGGRERYHSRHVKLGRARSR